MVKNTKNLGISVIIVLSLCIVGLIIYIYISSRQNYTKLSKNGIHPIDTFIIYAYYNSSGHVNSREEKNLRFLLKHGNLEPSNIIIVCNNEIIPNFIPKNIHVLKHKNHGVDFEAWYHGLQQINRKLYTNFIFINSSCIGPILPRWFLNTGIHWTQCFTRFLTDKTKLVGGSINHEGLSENSNFKHVQSYIWCTDNKGLDIILDNKILEANNNYDKKDTILHKEIGMSKLIQDKGYNIKGLTMSEMLNTKHGDIHYNDKYFGSTINPLEIIFYKNNRITTSISKFYDKCYDNINIQ